MKILFSAMLLASSVVTLASYELALIPTGGASPGITRYDPVNYNLMGEFANGLNSNFVDYHSPSERTFVHSTNGNAYTYNSSTGQRLATTPISATLVTMMADSTGTNLWSSDGANTITRTNILTGTALSPTLPASLQFVRTIIRVGNNRMLAVAKTAGVPAVAITFGGTASVLSGEPVTTGLFVNLRDAASIGQAAYLPGANIAVIPYFDTANSAKLTIISLTATGTISGVQNKNLNGAGFATNAPLAAIPTHVGFRVFGTNSVDTTLLQMKEYTADGIQASTRTTTMKVATGTFQASMIVAPEPSGVFALGLGALAMLRRRVK